jgi:hypothetical protein
VPRETPSPIDLPEPPLEVEGLGWAFRVVAVATLLLLFTNAVSLRDWIDDLPPGPLQARASDLAGSWLDLTRTLGVGVPRDALHDAWKRAEIARFPDQKG